MKQRRVATNYAVTREQKRAVAKNRMKKQGMYRICSKSRAGKHSSWFSDHWREYV